MEFQVGDLVATPKGNGYINDIVDDQVIVDLINGDHQRETFNKNELTFLPE